MSPSNTMWPRQRPTTTPSFILIHATVWPQYTNVTPRTGQDRTNRKTDRQWSDSIGQTVLQTVVTGVPPLTIFCKSSALSGITDAFAVLHLHSICKSCYDKTGSREKAPELKHFYSAQQYSHCKRCTSYGNSVCLSVHHTPVLCQNDGT